jgi:coenzyme PQQ biosynthesis protein PqqD
MDDGNYYSLNEIGSRIWELCDGNHSVSQLVGTLAAEYNAPNEDLENDVAELLETLQSGKLIV